MEARRAAGLNNAPPCFWSPSPPLELKGAPAEALLANAGFVTFGNAGKLDEVYLVHFLLAGYSSVCNNCSHFPTPCRRQKTGQNCLESINFSCIC